MVVYIIEYKTTLQQSFLNFPYSHYYWVGGPPKVSGFSVEGLAARIESKFVGYLNSGDFKSWIPNGLAMVTSPYSPPSEPHRVEGLGLRV